MTTEVLIARLRDTTALSDPLLTHEAADALEALGREVAELKATAEADGHAITWATQQVELIIKERDQARAELAAIRSTDKDAGLVADGWQPIETAPKDGAMFLAYVSAVKYKENDDGSMTEFDVSEIDFCQWTSIAHIEGTSPSDGYWDNMMSQIGDSYGVTHWMPLPASPKIGGV